MIFGGFRTFLDSDSKSCWDILWKLKDLWKPISQEFKRSLHLIILYIFVFLEMLKLSVLLKVYYDMYCTLVSFQNPFLCLRKACVWKRNLRGVAELAVYQVICHLFWALLWSFNYSLISGIFFVLLNLSVWPHCFKSPTFVQKNISWKKTLNFCEIQLTLIWKNKVTLNCFLVRFFFVKNWDFLSKWFLDKNGFFQ